MNDASIEMPAARWTRPRWLAFIALIFAAHVALIFLAGEKKTAVPRAATNVPTLKLADDSDELLALTDPTLFVLPHQQDFASAAWLKMPPLNPPTNRWTEAPHWLPLSAENLGATFQQFMQTNYFAGDPLDFKPPPELSESVLPVEPVPAQNSTMQIEGEIAARQLPAQTSLTNWPYADVLAPCAVQALVDAAGHVVSTVLLESSGYKEADDQALELARALRFRPSASPAFGRVIFNWHTVPPVNGQNR
jgi:TonB family protein